MNLKEQGQIYGMIWREKGERKLFDYIIILKIKRNNLLKMKSDRNW